MAEPATEPIQEPPAPVIPTSSDSTLEDLRQQVATMRGVMEKEREKAKEAERRAKAAEAGIDNGELEKLLAERQADERERHRVELEAKEKAIKAKEDAIKAEKEETRKRENALAELHLDRDFTAAFLKAGGDPDALEDATDKARRHYELNGSGLKLKEASLSVDGLRDDKGNPVGLEAFAAGWLRSNYPRYFPAKSGSGARPSTAPPSSDAKTMTAEQADRLGAAELMEWRAKGGRISD